MTATILAPIKKRPIYIRLPYIGPYMTTPVLALINSDNMTAPCSPVTISQIVFGPILGAKCFTSSDKQPSLLIYILFSMLISFSPNCTNSRGSTLLYFCALPETSELWALYNYFFNFPLFQSFFLLFFASFRLENSAILKTCELVLPLC